MEEEIRQIDVLPDVNWIMGLARHRTGFDRAYENPTARMTTLRTIIAFGRRAGVCLHTGPHVIENLRGALATEDVGYTGVTRPVWSAEDIERTVAFVTDAVLASGGQVDVETIARRRSHDRWRDAGTEDAEDFQVLWLAVAAGATVVATDDAELLALRRHGEVEIWPSADIDDEVDACLAAYQEALAAAGETA